MDFKLLVLFLLILNGELKIPGKNGTVSLSKCRLTSIGIAIKNVRWCHDCLFFTMGIPVSEKTVFILRQGHIEIGGNRCLLVVLLPWLCGNAVSYSPMSVTTKLQKTLWLLLQSNLDTTKWLLSKYPWQWFYNKWVFSSHRSKFNFKPPTYTAESLNISWYWFHSSCRIPIWTLPNMRSNNTTSITFGHGCCIPGHLDSLLCWQRWC